MPCLWPKASSTWEELCQKSERYRAFQVSEQVMQWVIFGGTSEYTVSKLKSNFHHLSKVFFFVCTLKEVHRSSLYRLFTQTSNQCGNSLSEQISLQSFIFAKNKKYLGAWICCESYSFSLFRSEFNLEVHSSKSWLCSIMYQRVTHLSFHLHFCWAPQCAVLDSTVQVAVYINTSMIFKLFM